MPRVSIIVYRSRFMPSMRTPILQIVILQILAYTSITLSYHDSSGKVIEPITLPYTWASGISCYYLDLDPVSDGYQQSITVEAGDLVVAEIMFQRWSIYGDDRVNQVFLLYSWSRNWNPPTHYLPLWFGVSGGYPGVARVWRFVFKAPSEPGVYYIWIRGDYASGMEEAIANIWYMYHGPPPYSDDGGGIIGRIVVEARGATYMDITLRIASVSLILGLIAILASKLLIKARKG
jgi:hypothetical protein